MLYIRRRKRQWERGDRSTQEALDEEAVGWLCRGTDISSLNTAGGFPTVKCPQGLRADLQFQSCWDGINLDSPDHKSHVAYLSDLDNGKCPECVAQLRCPLTTDLTLKVTALTQSPCPTCSMKPFGRRTSSTIGGMKQTTGHSSGPRGTFVNPVTCHDRLVPL